MQLIVVCITIIINKNQTPRNATTQQSPFTKNDVGGFHVVKNGVSSFSHLEAVKEREFKARLKGTDVGAPLQQFPRCTFKRGRK